MTKLNEYFYKNEFQLIYSRGKTRRDSLLLTLKQYPMIWVILSEYYDTNIRYITRKLYLPLKFKIIIIFWKYSYKLNKMVNTLQQYYTTWIKKKCNVILWNNETYIMLLKISDIIYFIFWSFLADYNIIGLRHWLLLFVTFHCIIQFISITYSLRIIINQFLSFYFKIFVLNCCQLIFIIIIY